MSDWLIGGIYLLGILHAVPAWYFGKAAGIRYSVEMGNQESKRHFLEAYAKRSGVTPEYLLAQGRVVLPCDCDYSACEGWQLVPRDIERRDSQ